MKCDYSFGSQGKPVSLLPSSVGHFVSCQKQAETGTPNSAMEKALKTTIDPTAAEKERRMDETQDMEKNEASGAPPCANI